MAKSDEEKAAAAAARQAAPLPPGAPPTAIRIANGALYDTATKSFLQKDGTAPARKPGRPRLSDTEKEARKVAKETVAETPPPKSNEEVFIKPEDQIGDRPTRRGGGAAPAAPEPAEQREFSRAEKIKLSKQVVGVHKMFAMFTGTPELVIDDQEGEMLAEAIAGIAREYGVAVSGKAAASMQMLATCAALYAPRALMISMRIAEQKRQRRAVRQPEQEGTVRGQSVTQPMPGHDVIGEPGTIQ